MLILPPSKAADMAHLCVSQNQSLGVCRGFVPDIQVCGTHGRGDLVNATITSNAEGIPVPYLDPGSHSHGAFPPEVVPGQVQLLDADVLGDGRAQQQAGRLTQLVVAQVQVLDTAGRL